MGVNLRRGWKRKLLKRKARGTASSGWSPGSPDWDIDGAAFLTLDAAVWGIDIELATAAADCAVRASDEPVRVGSDQIL
jgi:hypothetical protein